MKTLRRIRQTGKAFAVPLLRHLRLMPRLDELETVREQYKTALREMERCFRELVFPDLPECENRLELMAELLGTGPSEALYILGYLHQSLETPGDVCELGVAQGATSALLANEIRRTDKTLWLFDSFEGLPRPDAKDELLDDIFNLGEMEAYEGTMACPIHMVKERLAEISYPFSRVKIVPGFVEETLAGDGLPEHISFAYVDLDFYSGTLATLIFLEHRLSPGGAALVDDYGFFSSGAKTAVDEFVADRQDMFELVVPLEFAGPFCIVRKKTKENQPVQND